MFNLKKTKKEPENLKEVLSELKKTETKLEKTIKDLEDLKTKNKLSLQKFSIIRFNPFKEVGGDQSFSVALLDDGDSGVVITSHYTREGNRVYGKPIKNGQSEYKLSDEEIKAIDIARNGRTNQ